MTFSFSHKVATWNGIFNRYDYFGLPPSDEQRVVISSRGKRKKLNSTTEKLMKGLDGRIQEMVYWSFRKLTMDQCILPMSRTYDEKKKNAKLITTDKCIFIRDKVLRRRAIAWRLNSMGSKRICPLCQRQFRRSHINKCNYMNTPPFNAIIKEKDIEGYKEDLKNYPYLPNTYNILDSLLNHKRYNVFGKFMEELYKHWIT